jgi:two-component system, chemotaxis family, chemotaxis protein CheY
LRVSPSFAYLYAGEIARIVLSCGTELRAVLAPDQPAEHAISIVVHSAAGTAYGVEAVDFTKVRALEIDGPRHPKDLSAIEKPVKRVLVVDDDPNMRTLINMRLKNSFEVTTCDSGEAALVEASGGKRFDFIISDLLLPGISGLELIRRLRMTNGTSETPILMITSDTDHEMERRARAEGADAFLHKPLALSQLGAAITRVLQTKRAAQASL